MILNTNQVGTGHEFEMLIFYVYCKEKHTVRYCLFKNKYCLRNDSYMGMNNHALIEVYDN